MPTAHLPAVRSCLCVRVRVCVWVWEKASKWRGEPRAVVQAVGPGEGCSVVPIVQCAILILAHQS